MEWIKWYRETGVRQQENDLRAVALQNQRAELDFNMERLRQQGVTQEQANQPLYTIPGEPTSEPYPGATGEGPRQTRTATGPPTVGPTPNQVEAVQKVGQYMTPEGLKRMGMAPKPAVDKFRNVSPGDVVIDETGKEIYKAPAAQKQQAIDWKQDAGTGEWIGLPATRDLPSLMSSGEIPPNATVTDAGNGQVEVRVPPTQQDTQIKETNVSPIPMQGRRGQTQSPRALQGPPQAPQGPPQAQQQAQKPQPGVIPIRSGVIGKTTPKSPHNDLESYTGTLYPGKTWTELTPKEQDKVIGVIAKEASAKRGPSESNADREHLGNAYKSAYNMEMNKLLAVYKIMPPPGATIEDRDILDQMLQEAKNKGKMSATQFKEFAQKADELYDKFMVPWYKLYNIKGPEGTQFSEKKVTGSQYVWNEGKLEQSHPAQ